MSLITRAKNIILSPKTEWAVIADEEPNAITVFFGYAFPLIIASAVAGFIGHTFIWHSNFEEMVGVFSLPPTAVTRARDLTAQSLDETVALSWGFFYAFKILVLGVIGVWLVAAIINTVSKKFGSEKNMGRSMQLVVYAMTPVWIGGLLMIYPPITFIGLLFGLYGLYLLYLGLPQIMKPPQDKSVPYTITSIVILLVIYFGLAFSYATIFVDIIAPILGSIRISARPDK